MPLITPPMKTKHSHQQRGITLFVVIVFVLLTTLLALWGSRTAIFSEMVVGNDADYQRAFEAAQALLQDAELDIRNEKSDGSVCKKVDTNLNICREGSAGNITRIPLEEQDVSLLIAKLDAISSGPKCLHGICVKRSSAQDFWNNKDASKGITLAAMEKSGIGARYGQYTGAMTGTASNPILADQSAENRGGWYWIEIMRYDKDAGNTGLMPENANNLLPLQLDMNVVYRITAIAHGLKPNTMVVLQQTYARKRLKD